MELHVLTIGNALIDAFLSIHDASEYVHFDRERREFRLAAGEKIQLDKCVFEVGGNACNVAVGLSRLGFTAGLMAEIGEDEFSETIIKRLEKEEVDISHVQRKGESSFAIGINVKNERTLFVEHVEREHKFSFNSVSTNCFYLTSMGQKWHHVYQSVRDYARKQPVFLALNPGTKQLSEAPGFIRDMLPFTDVLFINKEEGFRLTGLGGKQDVKHLLQALKALGAQTVVVTDGHDGSYVIDPDTRMFHAPTIDVPIVERTGAGDAYAVGFLAALLSGKDTTEAMRWGTLSASSVIGKVGAQPGLLTRSHLHEYLEEYKLVVKEIG